MRAFFKYLFVFISIYLMLDFAVSNPEKISNIKDLIDLNIEKAIEYISEIKENENV